jgi:hypothetical protein
VNTVLNHRTSQGKKLLDQLNNKVEVCSSKLTAIQWHDVDPKSQQTGQLVSTILITVAE